MDKYYRIKAVFKKKKYYNKVGILITNSYGLKRESLIYIPSLNIKRWFVDDLIEEIDKKEYFKSIWNVNLIINRKGIS